MEPVKSLYHWADTHRDLAIDLLRIYLGIGLFVKGAYFVGHAGELLNTMQVHNVPAASVGLAHYAALAHLAGGILMALGLLTRWSALVQLPVLFGAVFFVNLEAGLFTPSGSLEFSVFVLFSLLLITAFGAGKLSLDYYLRDLDPLAHDEATRGPEGTRTLTHEPAA